MHRILFSALVALALFGGGYWLGLARQAPAARAQFGADYCAFRTRTEYLSSGGSFTYLTAVVAEWNSSRRRWNEVSDYTAKSAVGSFSCEKEW